MSALVQSVPEGFKKTEAGVIPTDWEVRDLATLCRSPITYGIVQCGPHVNDGVPYIRVSDMNTRNLDVASMLRTSKEIAAGFKRSKVDEGDIVYALRGKIGEVRVVDEVTAGANLTQGTARIAPKPKHSGKYMFWALQSENSKEQAEGESKGSTFKEITLGNLQKILLALPNTSTEQTAIANALSDVDALLIELENLIAKKQAIKIASMQQLLTGKTRLPQFATYTEGAIKGKKKGTKPSELGEIPEDWGISPLSKVLKDNPKYGINAAAVPLQGNLPVYIRITDISEDGYFKPTELVGVNSPFSNDYQLETGDIVLARTGASVGKSYLYNESDGKLVYAGFLIKVSSNKDKLKPEYLFQYLKTEQYWSWVTVNSMRSGQPGINGNEYGQLPVPIPSIEEQTAIATILSDMDNEIQTLEQRLHKTRQIKQGMMQELLTGRTRLPLLT